MLYFAPVFQIDLLLLTFKERVQWLEEEDLELRPLVRPR
jgi:hypothetical protein